MVVIFIWLIILIASLLFLIKSSDYFTDSAEIIGKYFHVPSFIIGITIVSIGTSLPELLTAIFGVVAGSTEIVIGDVVGSNITNILLGLGILPLIGAAGYIRIKKDLVSTDLPILVASSLMIAVTCLDGIFTWIEALFMLAGLFIYLSYSLATYNNHRNSIKDKFETRESLGLKHYIILFVSCVVLYFSAKYTVLSVIKLSEIMDIGTEVITASAVALGTSLPEIITSIVSVKKGKIDLAVGTLLGSNIFNAFAIMGIAGLISSLIIPQNMILYGIYMLLASTTLYFFIMLNKEVTRWEGLVLILFYLLYLGKLINLF